MIYLHSVLVAYCCNFWQATSSLPFVTERYFPTLSWLPAATSDLVLLLVLVKWKGWETKSHSHLGAGLQEAAGEVGIHTSSLSHPQSLLCSLTLLLRASNNAIGDFNNGKLTIPPRLKNKKSSPFLLSNYYFFFKSSSECVSTGLLQLFLPLSPIVPFASFHRFVLLSTITKHFPSLLHVNPHNDILFLHVV